MPTIRIEPGKKAQQKEQRGQAVGAIVGKTFGGPGLVVFAAKMGGDLVKALKNYGKEPVYSFEVDTETNKLTLLAPDYAKSVNTKTRALAPRMQALDKAVEAQLQDVWNSGEIAAGAPKRYLPQLQELLSQRAIFYREPDAAPASPIEYEGGSYSGAYSMAGIVPPGGFSGFAQMTPTSKAAQGFGRLLKAAGGRRRRKKAKSTKRRAKKTRSRKRKAGKLVKGSAAAKRFMANLRRKRK